MASITIRSLDDELKARLRLRAARHARSMEEEAREILRLALSEQPASEGLVATIRRRLEPLGGVELPEIDRDAVREPPSLDR